MPQPKFFGGLELLEPPGQEVEIRECVHAGVWVVDLTSRRVIRCVCAICTTTQRAVVGANSLCAGQTRDGNHSDVRQTVVVSRRS